MSQRKRGDAPFLILKYLAENGPASYEDLSRNIPLPLRTVEYDLRNILFKRFNLVKKLSNDKYALIWYQEEKDDVDRLKRKLLRNPKPEELAFLIKRTASEARDLLLKYIPGYREPTEEEMASSAKTLWKLLIRGSLNQPSKKEFFEKDVEEVVVQGIDQETLDEMLANSPTIALEDAKKYITEFPELKPEITEVKEIKKIVYNVKWSDEAKTVLNLSDISNNISKTQIPKIFKDVEGKLPFSGRDIWEACCHAKDLSEIYVPSQGIIDLLIESVGLPHLQCMVMLTLKQFCQNALEVDQLNEDNKERIVVRLLRVAFAADDSIIRDDYTNTSDVAKERNIAFDIIMMLNVRTKPTIDVARKFVNNYLDDPKGCRDGPDIHKVVKWLAKDPELRKDLAEKVERLLMDPPEFELMSFYKNILSDLT